MTAIDPEAIRIQLGLSREEMIAKFGNPGEKTPEEIGSALGLDHDAIVKIFGEKVSTDSGDSFKTSTQAANGETSNKENTQHDDNIKSVADKLGFDVKTVEQIMSAISDGSAIAGMDHKTAVETLAGKLGIDKYYVGMVLEYLDEAQITPETSSTSADAAVSSDSTSAKPSDEQVQKDDNIKSVADKLGFDAKTVEQIMSAIADGTAIAGMDHKTAVETLAEKLAIDKYYVGMVLEFLFESQTTTETSSTSSDSAVSTKSTTKKASDKQVQQDDKVKSVADKLGFDVKTVEQIMSAIADGTAIAGMDHQSAVETLATKLGIDKYYVGMVLEYLDESSQ